MWSRRIAFTPVPRPPRAPTVAAFTVQIGIPYGSYMPHAEEAFQLRRNQAGTLATGEILQQFDTERLADYHE